MAPSAASCESRRERCTNDAASPVSLGVLARSFELGQTTLALASRPVGLFVFGRAVQPRLPTLALARDHLLNFGVAWLREDGRLVGGRLAAHEPGRSCARLICASAIVDAAVR
jgi:hypothetical protein